MVPHGPSSLCLKRLSHRALESAPPCFKEDTRGPPGPPSKLRAYLSPYNSSPLSLFLCGWERSWRQSVLIRDGAEQAHRDPENRRGGGQPRYQISQTRVLAIHGKKTRPLNLYPHELAPRLWFSEFLEQRVSGVSSLEAFAQTVTGYLLLLKTP